MRVWIVQSGEEIPGIDPGAREWRCSMLAKALVERGHSVFWWGASFNPVRRIYRFNRPRTIEIMPGWTMRFLHGPGYKHSRSLKRMWHHRSLAIAFARESQNHPQPDILLASLPIIELAERAVEYGRRRSIPVIVDIRDLWPDHYLTLVPKQLRGIFRLILIHEFIRTKRLLRRATGLTAISSKFLDWGLLYAGRERGPQDAVFPMGYPTLTFPQEEILEKQMELCLQYDLKNKFVVVFVGSINSVFDFTTVIQAARILQQKHRQVRFIIVGDGSHAKQVRETSRGLSNFILTGWMDKTSVAAMLRLASVGLAPYVEGRSISGSLPNKAFEYMAFGLPILSSHRGDLEQLIRKERIGLQYQSGDPQSLVNQIYRLIKNPWELEEMRKHALYVFETKYKADIVYSRMAEYLEKAATRKL